MIKAMIAEDERIAREELEYILSQDKDLTLLPSAKNGKELLDLFEENTPDVVFLDIKMPEMDGVQVAKLLSSKERKPLIVFITAYEEYALKAFGLNAVDYILKPYDIIRINETLTRVRERGYLHSAKSNDSSNTMIIEADDKFIVVNINEIIYAEIMEKYIEIKVNEETHRTRMTLKQLEEQINQNHFYRVHRSFLVNLDYAHEITPWINGAYNLTLIDKKTKIPVPRNTVKNLIDKIKESKKGKR